MKNGKNVKMNIKWNFIIYSILLKNYTYIDIYDCLHQDIKNGGTPLHWASEKPILDAFLDAGCDIKSKVKFEHLVCSNKLIDIMH